MTVAAQQNSQIHRRLQLDSINMSGKTVYINPFLYWRRFDSNTDRWLREPGQLGEEQIKLNRNRFYPELDWEYLDEEECELKDAAVEMFLKSMELISTFHPELSSGQLLEVERKMAVTKKIAFEKWVEKSFRRRFRQESLERQRFERERVWRTWREWLTLEPTRQALVPVMALLVLATFTGWSMGVSNNRYQSLVNSTEQTGNR